MKKRLFCSAITTAVILVSQSFTMAQVAGTADNATKTPPGSAPEQPAATPPAPTPDKPLDSLLKKAGVDTEKFGFSIYGFVEGSYTYSTSNPPDNAISGRVFDVDNQEGILNQIDLSLERTVDAAALAKAGNWGYGGKVELLYGADSRFIHANGLNFYGDGAPQLDPENQFDLVQAYVDVVAPVGNGLLIRTGKFVTLLGIETINPTTNAFYSHSYEFGYAIPFTQTGVLATYSFTDKLTVTAGFTRGWEQSLEDNNESLDYMGQIKYVFDDKLTGYLNVVTGPEQTGNNSNYRTVVDAIVTYTASDKLSFGVDGDYGWEANAAADGGTALWYGVAGYASYKVSDQLTANGRLEFFNDEDGSRGLGGRAYEATLGVAYKPFSGSDLGSNLTIRPEVRYDWSDDDIFDAGTDDSQLTAAVDVIFTF